MANHSEDFFQLKTKLGAYLDTINSEISELEARKNLLTANAVVIENQPSFKNPRMKSIATTLYDYYLIRGIIDKDRTKSSIKQVKFMSPSNKLKEFNTETLDEADNTKKYKITKKLYINNIS